MMMIQSTKHGLYCHAGDFYIDPWRPVERAIITHAHADHARAGSASYLCSSSCAPLLAQRVQPDASIEGIPFGETRTINGVQVSLHPAGHLLGSAQVRVEHRGEVWVASGDYKTTHDQTCERFEAVPCHAFISECTFGLPIYRWPDQNEVFDSINAWRRQSHGEGRNCLLFAYALGKAQRLLAGLDADIGPILLHGAVQRFADAYRQQGVTLPDTLPASAENAKAHKGCATVIAPPSAASSTWARKFHPASQAFVSGWMQVRGARRRRAVDRGFVLSDHADWPGLLDTINATGAERVFLTHGYTGSMSRWLREQGIDAHAIDSRYVGENDDDAIDESGD